VFRVIYKHVGLAEAWAASLTVGLVAVILPLSLFVEHIGRAIAPYPSLLGL